MNAVVEDKRTKKKHFEILDALRGVAAIVVAVFHLLEVFSGGDHTKQLLNHGYLAVDFFFLLSGFVIVHAYDSRWVKMSLKDFFKRRLIRLHPMILIGMTLGLILFYPSASEMFPFVAQTPVWKLILVYLIGLTLIPVPLSLDIRGWTEMYPLNGPAWSLFFEYVANLFYALVLRKASNLVLFVLVAVTGGLLVHLAVSSPNGDLIGGWSLTGEQLQIGITRLLFPFLAGMLLRRMYNGGVQIKGAALLSAVLLTAFLVMPRIAPEGPLWMNGLYDSLVVILIFPLIVFLGASGSLKKGVEWKLGRFLGDISYPLYITHFPIVYVYYAWVNNNNVTLEQAWPVALGVLLLCLFVAYASMKWFDTPVRRYLTGRFQR